MKAFFADYFARYAKCYDDFDAERLAAYYFAPTLMVKTGSGVTLSTPDGILAHLKMLLASYREHGYQKGNLAGLDVLTQGHWGAVVTVHWVIDHVNGSVLRDFKSSYNLFKPADEWQILVTTNHDNP